MFTLPSIALFIHIVGAIALYSAIGIEWVFLTTIRRATHISIVKQWFGIMANMGRLHGPSWLAILSSGIYLAAEIWGFESWISVTFVIIIMIIFLGAFVSGRTLRSIGQSVAQADSLTDEIKQKLNSSVFIMSASLRTALALEIILLMTIKPDLTGSLISLGIALLIGYLAQAGKNKSAATIHNVRQETTK